MQEVSERACFVYGCTSNMASSPDAQRVRSIAHAFLLEQLALQWFMSFARSHVSLGVARPFRCLPCGLFLNLDVSNFNRFWLRTCKWTADAVTPYMPPTTNACFNSQKCLIFGPGVIFCNILLLGFCSFNPFYPEGCTFKPDVCVSLPGWILINTS